MFKPKYKSYRCSINPRNWITRADSEVSLISGVKYVFKTDMIYDGIEGESVIFEGSPIPNMLY